MDSCINLSGEEKIFFKQSLTMRTTIASWQTVGSLPKLLWAVKTNSIQCWLSIEVNSTLFWIKKILSFQNPEGRMFWCTWHPRVILQESGWSLKALKNKNVAKAKGRWKLEAAMQSHHMENWIGEQEHNQLLSWSAPPFHHHYSV